MYIAECIYERSLTAPYALYLCAGQHDTGCISIDEEIVVLCLLVTYINFCSLSLCHNLCMDKLNNKRLWHSVLSMAIVVPRQGIRP